MQLSFKKSYQSQGTLMAGCFKGSDDYVTDQVAGPHIGYDVPCCDLVSPLPKLNMYGYIVLATYISVNRIEQYHCFTIQDPLNTYAVRIINRNIGD